MIDATTNLHEFFSELLDGALNRESCEVDAPTRLYLEQLCVDFSRARQGREGGTTATLAWLYRDARCAPANRQFEAYRKLGDVALVAPSLFGPYVDRRRSLVGRSYYIDMGAAAYDAAAARASTGVRHLLQELSSKFRSLVDVLTRVAEATTLPMQDDLERLVHRLQQDAHDTDARQRLVRQGLVPVWGTRAMG